MAAPQISIDVVTTAETEILNCNRCNRESPSLLEGYDKNFAICAGCCNILAVNMVSLKRQVNLGQLLTDAGNKMKDRHDKLFDNWIALGVRFHRRSISVQDVEPGQMAHFIVAERHFRENLGLDVVRRREASIYTSAERVRFGRYPQDLDKALEDLHTTQKVLDNSERQLKDLERCIRILPSNYDKFLADLEAPGQEPSLEWMTARSWVLNLPYIRTSIDRGYLTRDQAVVMTLDGSAYVGRMLEETEPVETDPATVSFAGIRGLSLRGL